MWKQFNCSSVWKWVNKLVYIQPWYIYLVMKRNELLIHTITWIDLKVTVLWEKGKYFMIPSREQSRNVIEIIEMKSRLVDAGN